MVHPSIAKVACNLKIMKHLSILTMQAHSNMIGNGAYVQRNGRHFITVELQVTLAMEG